MESVSRKEFVIVKMAQQPFFLLLVEDPLPIILDIWFVYLSSFTPFAYMKKNHLSFGLHNVSFKNALRASARPSR